MARSLLGAVLLQTVHAGLWETISESVEGSYFNAEGWYFQLGRVKVVDAVGQNLLMRMGTPTVSGITGPAVSHAALLQALNQSAGSLFPVGPVELVDVTLLDQERNIIAAEQEGFGEDLVQWPLSGVTPENFTAACKSWGLSCPASMQPSDLASADRLKLAVDFEHWNADDLHSRVTALRSLLEQPGKNGTPRVIFFHCLCGCDRTGELFAAYAMRYLNESLTRALEENELVAGRHMYYHFQVAAQWYCESLRLGGLYAHDDCGNCGPFRCQDTGVPLDPIFSYVFACLGAAFATVVCGLGLWWCRGKMFKEEDSDFDDYGSYHRYLRA